MGDRGTRQLRCAQSSLHTGVRSIESVDLLYKALAACTATGPRTLAWPTASGLLALTPRLSPLIVGAVVRKNLATERSVSPDLTMWTHPAVARAAGSA